MHERPAWYDSAFMRAARREAVEYTPIWLMRQAGRYQPQYRAIREKHGFLELCKTPALAAEVMLMAVEQLGVDAAIIFADLLPILEPMGMDLEFAAGEGPVIHNPIREPADVDRLVELEDLGPLEYVMETVRKTRAGLDPRLPLLGFAGAPFTLAGYAIEGGASRDFARTKRLMLTDPAAWDALLGRLARAVARYLNAQIAAGAQAVQLFDSWVGCLGPDEYRRHVLPHTRSVIAAIAPGVPVVTFRHRQPGAAAAAERGGRVGDRDRLARASGRGVASGRLRPGRARQPRSRRPVDQPGRNPPSRQGDSRPGRGPAGPHLQPRPRHPS